MQDEVSGEEESTVESNDLPGDQAEVNEAEKLNEEIVAELLADDELSGTEELEEQVSKANDQVLRVQAEIQNIRRRAERDVENAHKYALEKFTADLLPVVDNLERAISTIDASDEGQKAVATGLELTLKTFVDALDRFKIEAVDPAKTGFLGGFGLPIIFSWIVGAFFAGGLAFIVGKVALGLRADYLAIATILISEIVIAIIKHEDWLTRGVKNVIGLKRPAPYEVDLQTTDWFINLVEKFNSGKLELISNLSDRQAALNQLVIEGSSVFVKLCYSGLFLTVVIILLILTQKALYSPWGRMMRAIRDNEEAANAMGKNVVKQHLLIFILGSAIVGIAGAMLVTQDGLFTPGSYRPMRYTFLIWVMVIVGGSGNNFGAILGGFVVWFLWIEAAPIALFLINFFTAGIPETNALKAHLIESVPYFRFLMMGLGLLLIMRFRPKGILPEKIEIK